MATKTISLTVEAYERLRRARRTPKESFSQVVMRAAWNDETVTGRDLLARLARDVPRFTEDEIAAVERVKKDDRPPELKW